MRAVDIAILVIILCLVGAYGVNFGGSLKQAYIEEVFGLSYGSLMTEVAVCKALADDDSECHISMKVIEKYPVNIDTVGNRRDRFCENFDMKGKVPDKRIYREAVK